MDQLATRTPSSDLLLLGRSDIARLMQCSDYLDAVTAGFRAAGEGRANAPAPLHLALPEGGFHVKAASLASGRRYAAFKINGNFPANPELRGLPTIQGALLLCDGDDGRPLAIMDSAEITIGRTAAATALAAQHLALPESRTVTVFGCGAQAARQLHALCEVLPLERALVCDIDPARAEALAAEFSSRLATVTLTPEEGLRQAHHSEVVVTCTTSREAFLKPEHVSPGAFVAAVGADSAGKSEIAPALMARAIVVADVIEQAAAMGDLRTAIAARAMTLEDVRCELADLACNRIAGRRHDSDIVVFDSTGTALQDVAAAVAVYARAQSAGMGVPFPLTA
jgi:ornithine cyclodeaminase/alanine dehydrogenase-like protein (mu-crystallin family)